jgi:ketosteroid isomerase-like protein
VFVALPKAGYGWRKTGARTVSRTASRATWERTTMSEITDLRMALKAGIELNDRLTDERNRLMGLWEKASMDVVAVTNERDRLAATVGRLAGFIGTCRNCCEVYDGRCRKGREVPGLAALGGRKEG